MAAASVRAAALAASLAGVGALGCSAEPSTSANRESLASSPRVDTFVVDHGPLQVEYIRTVTSEPPPDVFGQPTGSTRIVVRNVSGRALSEVRFRIDSISAGLPGSRFEFGKQRELGGERGLGPLAIGARVVLDSFPLPYPPTGLRVAAAGAAADVRVLRVTDQMGAPVGYLRAGTYRAILRGTVSAAPGGTLLHALDNALTWVDQRGNVQTLARDITGSWMPNELPRLFVGTLARRCMGGTLFEPDGLVPGGADTTRIAGVRFGTPVTCTAFTSQGPDTLRLIRVP